MNFFDIFAQIGGYVILSLLGFSSFFIPHTTSPKIEQKVAVVEETKVPPSPPLPATTSPQPPSTNPPVPKKETNTKKTPSTPPVVTLPPPSPVFPSASKEEPVLSGDINTFVRSAVVNVLCTSRGDTLRPISGSGVIIDSRGVILTNAHVAQFFLLRDYPEEGGVDCIIRAGNPAAPLYRATVLYLPAAWVALHAKDIVETNPVGTGEFDFALLLITGRTDESATLPPSFPALSPELLYEPPFGSDVFLAGYPAGLIGGISIQTNLYQASAFSKVSDIFTFATSTTDLISVGGTVVSQKGSSGGAAVDVQTQKLWGLIVTSTIGETTGTSDLRAITLPYINRALISLTGGGLSALLLGDIAAKAAAFSITTAPTLTKMLTDALNSR